MRLIPYDKFKIVTSDDFESVMRKINSFHNNQNEDDFHTYKANLKGNRFKLKRVSKHSRNAFMPIIIGTVDIGDETIIYIEMKLKRGVFLFLCFFYIFLLFGSINILYSQIESGNLDLTTMYLIMFYLIPYLIVTLSFNKEHKKCKEYLVEYFSV